MSEVKRYRFIDINGYPALPVCDGVKAEKFVEEQDFDRVTAERDAALEELCARAGTIGRLTGERAELHRQLDHKEQQRESELRNGQAADERVDVLEHEVERLKGISDNYCSLLMDTNSRFSAADLATAAIKAWTDETRQSVLESFQEELNESAGYEWYDNAISDLMRLVSTLKPAQAAHQETKINQCDGCQAGIPLINGTHRMGEPDGYANKIKCTANLYK